MSKKVRYIGVGFGGILLHHTAKALRASLELRNPMELLSADLPYQRDSDLLATFFAVEVVKLGRPPS